MVASQLTREDLFLSYPFFHDFDYFIEIEIISKDEESFYKWKGLIQARLRYLLAGMDMEIGEKAVVQLWPQEYNVFLVSQPEYRYCCFYYIGAKASSYDTEMFNLTHQIKQWKLSVYEQWDGDQKDNLVFALIKKRNELENFVHNPLPRGFIKYEGIRDIFPQEKEPSNLLSRLIPENPGQLYMSHPSQLPGYIGLLPPNGPLASNEHFSPPDHFIPKNNTNSPN
jgi:hypothetical protein